MTTEDVHGIADYVGFHDLKDEDGQPYREARYADGGGNLLVRHSADGVWEAEHWIRGRVHLGEPKWKLCHAVMMNDPVRLAEELDQAYAGYLAQMVRMLAGRML